MSKHSKKVKKIMSNDPKLTFRHTVMQFIEEPFVFTDEPIQYCQPTPRSYARCAELEIQIRNKKDE